MNTLDTIRYMGVKTNLLHEIIPAIQSVTPSGSIVLDLMAGSNAVSYALKKYYTVYTNDVQEYSYTISKAIIENQKYTISKEAAHSDLDNYINENIKNKYYTFFESTYSSTYFSKEQCVYIDSIRYAISKVKEEHKQALYLFALMCAMCKVQSTPGHFAQYMPSDHKRIIPLQKMNILNEFYSKCDNYQELIFTQNKNKSFCMDFHKLLTITDINKVKTIYLDSPYSQEQYSRFYHVLETLVKYDNPIVNFKAKYRDDRFQSNFCYKSKVASEFKVITTYCKNNNINLVISYSNKALLPIAELEKICQEDFSNVEVKLIDYKHSTQGKGSQALKEVLIICS